MKDWKACVRTWEGRTEKTQSKVAIRLSSHEMAKEMINKKYGNK